MAVAFDNVSSTSAAASSGPSFSHNNIAGNALYVVVAGWDGTGRTVTVTYAGAAMTQIADSGLSNAQDRAWLFQKVAPATGSNTVAVTVSGGVMHLFCGGVSVTGADQATFSSPVTAVSAVSGDPTLNVTGTVGGFVVDGLAGGVESTATATGAAGHTERWDVLLPGQGECGQGGTTVADGTAQTISWNLATNG